MSKLKDRNKNSWQLHVASAALVIAIYFFNASYDNITKYYRINKIFEIGISADGIIDHVQWKLEGSRRNTVTRYYPVVDFKDKNNKAVRFQDYLDIRYGLPSQKGTNVTVLYDRNEPSNAMIESDKNFLQTMHDKVFLYIGLIAASLCTSIVSYISYFKLRKKQKI